MIVITGAAGFIASAIAGGMNQNGVENLVLVDDFDRPTKVDNWKHKKYAQLVDRKDLDSWLLQHGSEVEAIVHMGARSDTTEPDWNVFLELNLGCSQMVWQHCCRLQIPMIYASSAATYGAGELGYCDSHEVVDRLRPLNLYGRSKNDFDKWALSQVEQPPFWAGLKFFNVYGPNEYHKGRMASVVLHTFEQVNENGMMNLFRSHRPDFEDGMQLRDFVYVKDIVKVVMFLLEHRPECGLYNLGTGKAMPFLELAYATFDALGKERKINFVDMPMDIRDKYQYYTQADMTKLRRVGYEAPFYSLREGVFDYVQNYLVPHRFL